MYPVRVPLPESLYSTETEEPFANCLVCERSLLDGSTDYLIEKGVRRVDAYDVEETVFDYALCADCHQSVGQSLSAHSKRRCQEYLAQHVDLTDRTASLLEAESIDPGRWTERCLVHDTPKEELEEYQVVAHCQGDSLLLTHLPLMIGGPAVDELTQRLSNETIDNLGGFRDEHFGPPPELEQDLQGPVLAA